MQECWTREAKDRPSIHAVLKRLQVLYKDHRSQGGEEGHVSASSPVTKPQGLRDLPTQNKIMSA